MSCTRNTRGSCIDANRLATSSASVATCSAVARSAASPAAPTSRMRRASYISSRVKPCERGEKAQRVGVERGRPLGNVGARSVARSHDAHGGERPQAGANRRPADADLRRQIALGRQAIARLQRAALDEIADVRDDLPGAAFTPLSGDRPAWARLPVRGLCSNGGSNGGSNGARGHGGRSASGAGSNARRWPEYRLGIGPVRRHHVTLCGVRTDAHHKRSYHFVNRRVNRGRTIA